MEAPHHLAPLVAWVGGPHAVTPFHQAALQQPPIPGEQDAPFRGAAQCQRRILCIRLIPGVKAEKPQVPGQAAQVPIHHELEPPQGGVAQSEQRPHIELFENREHRYPLSSAQAMAPTHGLAVHQHQFNLRMRRSQRLDHVFD
ncbi:MAG: hypothetical protein BWY79_02203 [Actinobacteria bacterium ADurb.Bin444]|nr:MAG: hypothetical protein BWY79_02203 [Actinobacteria bacterium ADurb.Bin444]